MLLVPCLMRITCPCCALRAVFVVHVVLWREGTRGGSSRGICGGIVNMHDKTLPGWVRQNTPTPRVFRRNFCPSLALLPRSPGVVHLMLYFCASVSVHVLRCMLAVW